MNDLYIMLCGAFGGIVSSIVISVAILSHFKFVYDEKLKVLKMQLVAIKAGLSCQNPDNINV